MSAGEHDATQVRPAGDLTEALPRAEGAENLLLTPGAILGDRYRIVSQLGRGGMGMVYRADDLRLGQSVALKFVGTEAISSATLRDEVRIGRQISHPNICRLYDIGDVAGKSFISMEYVDGEDLSSLLRRIGRLAGDRALAIARDICAGLGAIHAAGVVHRDLKPANVMIDNRGRARITDFGLALPQESSSHAHSAGTPAYMAPEQLAGLAASVRSDVFALGLVLYELFTGRRAYSATSSRELVALQMNQSYPRPSSVVRDIDPAVERVIARCLDPDADRRPESADAILRELPGYDPVAAAIAAGETPSAGEVADVASSGELSLGAAAAIALITIAGLVVVPFLARRTMLYGVVAAVKPPDVLEERARAVVAAAGVTARRVDSSSHVFSNSDQLRFAEKTRSFSVWRSAPSPLMFLYRQSPRPMATRNIESRVLKNDPPFVVPGMVDVALDSTGRLMEFATVPALHDTSGAAAPPDFTPLLNLAGVDPSHLTPAKPEWTAPVDTDFKQAWTTKIGGRDVRIEAAGFKGRPVWLAVITPWRPAGEPRAVVTVAAIVLAVNIAFFVVIPAAVVLIARRNLLRRQGDRRGAFAAAAFTLVLTFAGQLIRAHHPPNLENEWALVTSITIMAAFWAVMVWLAYIAIEPLVRRRWPHMLISLLRLLRGRWRDPMCGRDVAIGIAGGVIILVAWHLAMYVPMLLALPVQPSHNVSTSLGGTSHVVYWFLRAVFEGFIRITGFVVLLLVTVAIVRRTNVAIALSALLLGISVLGDLDAPLAFQLAYGTVAAVTAALVPTRVGVLASIAMAATIVLLRSLPLTSDPSDWYFLRSGVALGTVAFIAFIALTIATAGRRAFSRPLLEF